MRDVPQGLSLGCDILQAAPSLLPVPLAHAEADAHSARVSKAEMSDLGRTVMSWTRLGAERLGG
jgi:hypothetical protein